MLDTLMLEYEFDPKLCLCAWLLWKTQFKPWGVKKNSVPYMTEIDLPMFWFKVELFPLM